MITSYFILYILSLYQIYLQIDGQIYRWIDKDGQIHIDGQIQMERYRLIDIDGQMQKDRYRWIDMDGQIQIDRYRWKDKYIFNIKTISPVISCI